MKKYVFLFLACCGAALSMPAQVVFQHVATALNTGVSAGTAHHITILDHPELNGKPDQLLFVTTNWGKGTYGTDHRQNVGVWYDLYRQRWTIFNQNTSAPMPVAAMFNVMVVPPNTPGVFRHTVTAASKAGNGFNNGTRLDHPLLNGKADVMLMVTQNWTGTYNDNPVQAGNAGGCGLSGPIWWNISNGATQTNGSDYSNFPMPVGASFNVMVIEKGNVPGFPMAKAFVHVAQPESIIPAGQSISFFNHAALNEKPDAVAFVTPFWGRGTVCTDGPYVVSPTSVWYDNPDDVWNYKNKFWSVYNANGRPMPPGAKFNVIVFDGQQLTACRPNCDLKYTSIKRSVVNNYLSCLATGKINGSNSESNRLNPGAVILYQTSKGRLGKMEVLEYGYNLRVRCTTYNANGSVYRQKTSLTIRGTWQCDLDNLVETSTDNDFWWEQVNATERWLAPQNGAKFWVLCAGSPYMERYRASITNRPTRTITTILPGQREAQTITVEEVNGRLIYQGDIILGASATRRDAAIPVEDYKWAGARVPFVIADGHPRRADILNAINIVNTSTPVRFIPRSAERDYVQFNFVDDDCSSYVGRQGNVQEINIGNAIRCANGSILHEIMHALGFYHEVARSDRDNSVTINTANIQPDWVYNFTKELATRSVCPYDFGSIMHYRLNGAAIDATQNTIIPRVPIPAGVTVGQRAGFSACDLQGIRNLYSSPAPDEITDVRITIRTGGDDLRCNSQAVMSMTTSAGGTHDVMLNRGAGWGNGSTNTVTTRLPAGSTGIVNCTLRFDGRHKCEFFWEDVDNWDVELVRVELIRADGSIRVLAEESGTPVRRFLTEGALNIPLR